MDEQFYNAIASVIKNELDLHLPINRDSCCGNQIGYEIADVLKGFSYNYDVNNSFNYKKFLTKCGLE